jgi:hypothetical protein
MASLTKVLKTDVMADLDLKGLAQVLRAQGRGRDTVLAHITPREARKLKREGGSGTINPTTGLPEFEDFGGGGDYYDFAGAGDYQAATPETYYPDVTGGTYTTPGGAEIVPGGEGVPFAAPGYEPLSAPAAGQQPIPVPPVPTVGGVEEGRAFLQGLRGEQIPLSEMQQPASERGFFDRLGTSLEKQLSDPATLARLGIGIGGAGLGFLQQQRGAQQAKQAQRQVADIGAPYRAQGQELISQARAGELSPASMQAYQAAQAQIAQQTARQGGVGAAQGAATLERMRAQLLENQYNLGLRVANIGDQYMRGAIQTGMQANQALNAASTQFFTNLAATLSGPTVQSLSAAR